MACREILNALAAFETPPKCFSTCAFFMEPLCHDKKVYATGLTKIVNQIYSKSMVTKEMEMKNRQSLVIADGGLLGAYLYLTFELVEDEPRNVEISLYTNWHLANAHGMEGCIAD